MTIIATQNFDAGTEGALVSLSAPWSLTGGTGASPVTAAAAAIHGTRGIRYASTGAGPFGIRYDLGAPASGTTVCTFYFRFATLPSASCYLVHATDSGGTTVGEVRLSSSGALQMRVGGSTIGSPSPAISTGVTYRLEWSFNHTTPTATMRIYLGDSDTLWDTRTSGSWSTTAAQHVLVGSRTTAASGVNYDIDSIMIADDWTGPMTGDPLGVTTSPDVTLLLGQDTTVTASASGGVTPYTSEWTVESGEGVFDDDTALSTAFTPSEAGVHVIRCTVTDSDSPPNVEYDETTIYAQQRLQPVAVTGWPGSSLGGGAASALAALTDSNSSTYIQSVSDPSGEELSTTLPSMAPPEGDLTYYTTASTDLGTVSIVAELWTPGLGEQVATSAPITATTVLTEHELVFAEADILAASLDPTTDWAAGMIVVLVASVPE